MLCRRQDRWLLLHAHAQALLSSTCQIAGCIGSGMDPSHDVFDLLYATGWEAAANKRAWHLGICSYYMPSCMLITTLLATLQCQMGLVKLR